MKKEFGGFLKIVLSITTSGEPPTEIDRRTGLVWLKWMKCTLFFSIVGRVFSNYTVSEI